MASRIEYSPEAKRVLEVMRGLEFIDTDKMQKGRWRYHYPFKFDESRRDWNSLCTEWDQIHGAKASLEIVTADISIAYAARSSYEYANKSAAKAAIESYIWRPLRNCLENIGQPRIDFTLGDARNACDKNEEMVRSRQISREYNDLMSDAKKADLFYVAQIFAFALHKAHTLNLRPE